MKAVRKFVKPQTPPNSDINVTPLVDVVLVLLIIFMVVTPLLEKDIEVRVPDTETVDMPEELPDNQLVVQVDARGGYSINAEVIPEADYVPRLKRMLAAKSKEDRIVFFMAEDTANYGKLIAALDGAKEAGANVLGMATEDLPEGVQATPGAPPSPPGAAAPPPAP